jgi:hypothetical protein
MRNSVFVSVISGALSSPSPPRVTRSRRAIRKGKAGRLRKDEVFFHETKGWQSRLYL